MLPQRTLGREGPRVPALGLGCMSMSQAYGVPDDEESLRTLHHALDLGVSLLDTADVYGQGANERLVGEVLRTRRQEVFLATKCGIVSGAGGAPTGVNGSADYIRSACEASLARLGTDVIDLYYLHRVDPATPIEESMGAMAGLVRAGKVRFVGLSEAAPVTLRRAHQVHPVTALQSEYSLWVREPESTVLPVCRELGIAFVPFSPLGRGFLSGTVTDPSALPASDLRRHLPRFQGEHLQQNARSLRALEALAAQRSCTPAQLSLAWLLAQGDDIVPIPGTKRRTYLDENVAAAAIVLTPDERREIDAAFGPDAWSGDRYHEAMMRLVDRSH